MYKVILVDDEEWITESLKISIPWEEYGFEICATATNGEIALKKIIELHPDVIFSDIKMPCTNGLDLIAQAKKIIPDMFSVIISGYSEFEYAKTAIQHGVDGYCNKPIDEDEIIEHLKNFKFKLDMLKHRKNNLKLLDCIENNDKSMLLSLFPNNAASSFINIIVSIGGNIDVLEDKPDILYCRISTDRWVYFIQKSLESINQNKIRQILSENVKGVGIYEMNSYNDDLSVSIDKAGIRACQYFFDENQIVFSGNYNRDKIKRYNHLLNEIINQVNNKDAYALNKSFNDIKDNLKNLNIFELQKSYNILNTLKRLNIADVDVDANTDTDTNTDVDAVSVTDTDTSTDTGTGTGTYTSTDTGTGTGAYTGTDTDTGTYTGTDTDTGTDTHIDTDTDADADADALWLNQNSYLLKNWKNAEHYFTYFSLQINLLINKKNDDIIIHSNNELVTDVINYIKVNYTKNPSLTDLSTLFNINQSYLSQLFKKETGINILNYLTKLKMLKACDLLINTDMSINEIAQKVGYDDYLYFRRVFKKTYELTPTDYREKHKH